EVSAGAAKSVDLGMVNGRAISLDSNTLSLIDSVIAASLVETRKAYANPPVVHSGQPSASALNLAPESSIIGSLGTYFGKVAECNMSWEKLTEDLSHQQSNCPSFGKALDDLAVAAKDSLRDALDSTAEDAKRFAGGVGFVLGMIAGDGAPAIIAKLATTASFTQALGHLALSLETSDPQAPADRKQAIEFFKDYFGEKLKDAFNDQVDDAGKALLKSFSPADVNSDADYDALKGLPIRDAVDNTLALLRDATTTPEVPVDRPNADGTNFLDTTLDGSPAVDITGNVTNGSGSPLQNTGVQLTTGDDSVPPIAGGASLFDGSYDLPIPKSAIGNGIPNTAQLEVTTLDESGELVTFLGKSIDLTKGSQSLSGVSISYDSDDDGDDDSDGTNVRKPAKRVEALVAGQKDRSDNGVSAFQPTDLPFDASVRAGRRFHRPALAPPRPSLLGARVR
ncbi:MAG: hypothetical protein M3Y07_11275, partial [Acidobacteriota bacterium]|nr:hypothetical protein [Acidobacteriota bacterium]